MFAIVFTRSPRNFPCSSSASCASETWSRPCASEMNPSLRSQTHFTGRAIFPDAHVTSASSA